MCPAFTKIWERGKNLLKKEITTILFDLDGTLLPMDTDTFTRAYFKLLAQKAAPHGFEPGPLTDAVWKGTGAMVKNDGSVPNRERFWQVFGQILGEKAAALEPEFDDFYAHEFDAARESVGQNPLAAKAVRGLREKGYQVVLATNPIFPAVGVRTRLRWLGLAPEDFSLVTSYENSNYCKPNPDYYREILRKLGKEPGECLMVGNDAREDLAALKAGLDVYLVTDCLIDPDKADLSGVGTGTFQEFLSYAGVDA